MHTRNAEATGIPPDIRADAQIVADCAAAGQPVPPEVPRRVQERSAHARRQLLATHGVQNVGVQIIRELRGELPQP